jgi:hypothetical protein
LLSSHSGLPNNRHRRHRMRRQLQAHPLSRVLQHSNRPAHQDNQAHPCRGHPVNRRLPECRQARRECHRPVRLAPVPQDQLFRERLLLRH